MHDYDIFIYLCKRFQIDKKAFIKCHLGGHLIFDYDGEVSTMKLVLLSEKASMMTS